MRLKIIRGDVRRLLSGLTGIAGVFFISKDTLMLVWLSRFRYEVAVAHTDGLVGFLLLQQQLICTLFNEAPARRCRPMN
jgi:hypothetical protein